MIYNDISILKKFLISTSVVISEVYTRLFIFSTIKSNSYLKIRMKSEVVSLLILLIETILKKCENRAVIQFFVLFKIIICSH